METSRHLLFFGHPPRARLPKLTLTIIILAAGCAESPFPESVSPDVRAGTETLVSPPPHPSGPDILSTATSLPAGQPALFPGLPVLVAADDWWLIRRMDIFAFNDDGIRALDSYSRSYPYGTPADTVSLASGPKIVVAVANCALPDPLVTGLHCYEDLRGAVAEFTSDHPSYPVMSGEAHFSAGGGATCTVTLEPLMSVVEVQSLECRMEEPWRGQRLSGVRVYLTGVGNRAGLLEQEGFLPTETLNNGGLSEQDLGRLPYSGMVYKYLGNGRTSGETTRYDGASLYCYPNEAEEETFASPYTRLVVEGKIDGRTCYYAFPVNRGRYAGDGTPGIGRNRRYVFNLTITRPGTESLADFYDSGP